jgi:predicted dehydrogenase
MNLAIVGCGMVANEHLAALRRVREAKVVALCDQDKEAVMRMSRKWNVSDSYTDLGKMLNEQDLSIISVLTPPQAHVPVAIEAIKRNINVVIEKPLTMNTAEASRLLETMKNSTAKLTVDYILLFSKVMLQTSQLIRSGRIGDVLGARIDYLGTGNDPMTSTESHWSHKLLGGRLGEMLPHPIYVVQSLIGDELSVDTIVAEKRGKYPWMRYDELNVSLRGTKRGSASIHVSFNAPRDAINIDVYGTRKILRLDLINQTLMELGERSLSKVDSAKDLVRQSSNLFLSTIKNTMSFLRGGAMQYPLRNLYASFVDSVASGKDQLVTPHMAFETVRITEQLCNSIDNLKSPQ